MAINCLANELSACKRHNSNCPCQALEKQVSHGDSSQSVLNRFGKIGKVGHGIEQLPEILIIDITDEAVSQGCTKMFAALGKTAEAKVVVVKGINNFSHDLYGGLHSFSIAFERSRCDWLSRCHDRIDFISQHDTAFEGKENTR